MRVFLSIAIGVVLLGFVVGCDSSGGEKAVIPKEPVPAPEIDPETGFPAGSIGVGESTAAPKKE